MFSGGEKKSFYELSFVIGSGIIALKLKRHKLISSKSVFVLMYAKSGKKVHFFCHLWGIITRLTIQAV